MSERTHEFPLELLGATPEKRLDWFANKRIAHPKLTEVSDKLALIASVPEGTNLVLLFGPAGVGKTNLAERTVDKVNKQALDDPNTSIGSVPAAYTKLWAPEKGVFDWPDNYRRIGKSVGEPLMDKKVRPKIQEVQENGNEVIKVTNYIPDIRYGCINAIVARNTKKLFLDEAQRLLKIARGGRLQDQMDTLQAFAHECRALVVLVGTFDLLNLAMLSDQLDRRTIELSFMRYDCDKSNNDVKNFQTALLSLQRCLPVKHVPDLLPEWHYFYTRCLGCIGSLKIWLYRALEATLKGPHPDELKMSTIREYQSSAKNLNARLTKILEGERLVEDRDSEQQFQRLEMRLKTKQDYPEATAEAKHTADTKPGERKPVRDPVGATNV